MDKKLKYGSVCTSMLAIGLLCGFLLAGQSPTTFSVTDQVKHQGIVHVTVTRNGIVIYDYTTHNLVTTIGSTRVKEYLRIGASGAMNATDDVAVGNHTTPAITNTKLDTEATTMNLTRQSCTATSLNDTAYSVLYQRIASGTIKVGATSLHYYALPLGSANNVVAIALITQASLISGDTLKVT